MALDRDDPHRALADALPGQVLPGSEGRRYPLRDRIGEGGQGWVFRATWNGSVDVVVKVLKPDSFAGESLTRFQREAEILRGLSQLPLPNPHVVRFYDHANAQVQLEATGQSWELPFTVLELVEGETLESALKATQPQGLPLHRARRILRHVVLGLEGVHARNVVHRDLKPSNILLARSGAREIAKVTDFGLAKLLEVDIQRTAHLAGATIGYAPPEQFEDRNPRVGRHTDVFSLAAIFYEMLVGAPAFPVKPNAHPLLVVVRMMIDSPPTFAGAAKRLPRELAERPDVVAMLDAVLSRGLALEPHDRYPTVTAFFDAVEAALFTLGNTPSLPPARPSGGLLVRASDPPPLTVSGFERTISGESGRLPVTSGPSTLSSPSNPSNLGATAVFVSSSHPVALDVGLAEAIRWQRITDPLHSGMPRAIAIAPGGGRAAAFGARGPMMWSRGQWAPLETPPGVDPTAARVAAWWGSRLVFAGAGSAIHAFEPGAPPMTWHVDVPGIVLHGAYADAAGVLLVGERATPSGPVGVLVEAARPGSWGGKAWPTDVPGTTALRAVVRFSGGLLACGDAGALALFPGAGAAPRLACVCPAPLLSLTATIDGAAIAVGGGAFTFRVSAALETQLEATQTTRDLCALTRSPGGALWSGGEAARVLRRTDRGWIRLGIDGATARVLALDAAPHRLLAFCDDGSAFEGVVRQ